VRGLNTFLASLARAPVSAACSDGPALAIALFNHISRGAGPLAVAPSEHTYTILMDCCCRVHCPDLAHAFFGRLLIAGLEVDSLTVNILLKCLCHAKRTDEALNLLLQRMPELGLSPDVVAYNTVMSSFFKKAK
jgi:pentatricopeptide repeat protein